MFSHLENIKWNLYYIVYIEIDGVQVPVETGETELVYSEPVEFKGNISTSGGESKETEYGIDSTDYDAVLMMMKNDLPITETSIIWHTSDIGCQGCRQNNCWW